MIIYIYIYIFNFGQPSANLWPTFGQSSPTLRPKFAQGSPQHGMEPLMCGLGPFIDGPGTLRWWARNTSLVALDPSQIALDPSCVVWTQHR